LRSNCFDQITLLQQQKNVDKAKEIHQKATNHDYVITWASSLATDFCIKFHNENLGKDRLDLRGLKDEEAFDLFQKRFTEIERMSQLPFNQVEVIYTSRDSGKATLSQVEREIIHYLKDYHFEFRNEQDKGIVVVNV